MAPALLWLTAFSIALIGIALKQHLPPWQLLQLLWVGLLTTLSLPHRMFTPGDEAAFGAGAWTAAILTFNLAPLPVILLVSLGTGCTVSLIGLVTANRCIDTSSRWLVLCVYASTCALSCWTVEHASPYVAAVATLALSHLGHICRTARRHGSGFKIDHAGRLESTFDVTLSIEDGYDWDVGVLVASSLSLAVVTVTVSLSLTSLHLIMLLLHLLFVCNQLRVVLQALAPSASDTITAITTSVVGLAIVSLTLISSHFKSAELMLEVGALALLVITAYCHRRAAPRDILPTSIGGRQGSWLDGLRNIGPLCPHSARVFNAVMLAAVLAALTYRNVTVQTQGIAVVASTVLAVLYHYQPQLYHPVLLTAAATLAVLVVLPVDHANNTLGLLATALNLASYGLQTRPSSKLQHPTLVLVLKLALVILTCPHTSLAREEQTITAMTLLDVMLRASGYGLACMQACTAGTTAPVDDSIWDPVWRVMTAAATPQLGYATSDD